MRALDWSFSDKAIRDKEVLYFFAGSIEDMEAHMNVAFDGGLREAEVMRELLPLDSIPFRFARRYLVRNIQELPKDDEIRLACQALFLFLLRARVPVKCKLPFGNALSPPRALPFSSDCAIALWPQTTPWRASWPSIPS